MSAVSVDSRNREFVALLFRERRDGAFVVGPLARVCSRLSPGRRFPYSINVGIGDFPFDVRVAFICPGSTCLRCEWDPHLGEGANPGDLLTHTTLRTLRPTWSRNTAAARLHSSRTEQPQPRATHVGLSWFPGCSRCSEWWSLLAVDTCPRAWTISCRTTIWTRRVHQLATWEDRVGSVLRRRTRILPVVPGTRAMRPLRREKMPRYPPACLVVPVAMSPRVGERAGYRGRMLV